MSRDGMIRLLLCWAAFCQNVEEKCLYCNHSLTAF